MDEIIVSITESGDVRIETGSISGANHLSADVFLRELAKLCGGEQVRSKHTRHVAHVHNEAKQ